MEPISQLAQELINHIITFLHDSPADWPAIALVCRSWVDPAQSHIFRRLPLYSPRRDENQRRWARFHATSINSPRLIRHVRQLDVTSFYVSAETFHAICNFPFTHLERVLVSYSNPTPLHTLGMQQLLSLPTLCRLTIGCHETEPAAFFEIWERFSAGLRHLELVYYSTSTELFHPTHNSPSFIGLESFNLPFTAVLGLLDWLMHPLCLFDFSGLKALSTANGMELLGSSNFAPALETIQTLNLFPTSTTNPVLEINLSEFPSLTLLRITGHSSSWSWMLATLSTITSHSQITKIIIVDRHLDDSIAEQLDSQLSGMPISPIVELEKGRAGPYLHFPLLSSKNMLRRVDYNAHWFQQLTGMAS